MKKGLKAILIILILLAVIAGLGYVAFTRYKEKLFLIGKRADQTLDITTPVAISKVKIGSIKESLVLNGELCAETEVSIYSKVAGKIKEILVLEGAEVKREDVLAHIDRSEAGVTYALNPVESTIDGIVKKSYFEIGDYVTPQMPLFQIIKINEVEMVVHVPEKDIARIEPGIDSEIRVVSYPELVFSGRVEKVSPVVDPVSRTLEATIRIENRKRVLKPGMFGEVEVVLRRSKNAIVLPLAAVIQRNERDVVFIELDGKAVEVVPVFDIIQGDRISVLKGLKAGQNVIVVGQHNVSDGDRVTVTEEIE
jgi:membrane fusion protein (multidrug efflux system)